jgi:hypothetical protein
MQKTKTPIENQLVPPPSSFHQHWPYQICNARMFLVYLKFRQDQGPKQWSEQEKVRKETCGSDLLPQPRHMTDTNANATALHWEDSPPSLQKDAWATTAHRGSSVATVIAIPMGIDLFPLAGDTSNIFKSACPHREDILLLLQRHINTTRLLEQWWRASTLRPGS